MSNGQKSPHEDIILTVVVFGLVFGISWVIWHFFSQELTNFVRWVRVGELYLVSLFYGGEYKVYYSGLGDQVVGNWLKWLKRAPVSEISVLDIKVSTGVAVWPLRIFFIGIFMLMAIIILFKGPGTKYRRRMGLETLMQEQALSFPIIQPFLKFDPRKLPFRVPGQPVPAQLPLFAEALTPEEWLAYNEVRMVGGVIDANRAHQALVRQLGKRWQGPLKLPLHAQGLYAAFALKHVRKRKACDAMLDDLARAWSADKGFRPTAKLKADIRKAIKDPKIGGALQKSADQHAYETTALLRSLSRAREEGGVLAPAQFLWLRGIDRALWYPLNNLGRKSYHAEASGAMVHYTNELIAGQKIPTPRFDEVIRSFETYMKSGTARSIPELDRKAGGMQYWRGK